MIHISPEEFANAFQTAALGHEMELIRRWDSGRDYTTHMREVVLPAVAPHLGIRVYSADYYTLDCVYFADHDTSNFPANSTHANYLCVALEHENQLGGTVYEMNKLQLYNTPLKVLVTYSQMDTERAKYLEIYSRILREADVFQDFTSHRRQLVVFGKRSDTTIQWEFHVYADGEFVELGDQGNSRSRPRRMPTQSPLQSHSHSSAAPAGSPCRVPRDAD